MTSTALIMAGGTGGHIFPGLAVAEALRAKGWQVHWLGVPAAMEGDLVPPRGFVFEAIDFSGVRGNGLARLIKLPLALARATAQAMAVLRRVQPDVVVGMGGYISVPGGIASALLRKPLVIHEQNAVAGLSNRLLSMLAARVFTAFPRVLKKAQWVGNPLREAFLAQPEPDQRLTTRSGPLRLLVLGGSLGAKALNEVVPRALALMTPAERPRVLHQAGAKQLDDTRIEYASFDVEAELTPFIDDTARAMAEADVVLCRAGASTVTEMAAVGAAAVFVPFPYAVDDHQAANARFLVDAAGGWLLRQADLRPAALAELLRQLDRAELLRRATIARKLRKLGATEALVAACEALAGNNNKKPPSRKVRA